MLRPNFRYTLRSFFGFTFSLLLLCIFAQPAWACSYLPETNYWYKLNYEIPTELLPSDIEVSITYPPYDEYVYESALGYFEFTNNSAHDIYILPSDAVYRPDESRTRTDDYSQFIVSLADALAQNTPEDIVFSFDERLYQDRLIKAGTSYPYSAASRDVGWTFDLPQSPGGAESPPAASVYDLVLLHNDQFYRIPLTITYTLNPNYDESKILRHAPLSDYMIMSDNIVLGEVIGAAPDSELIEDLHPVTNITSTYVVGSAHISVEEWVFGEGPDEIYVERFFSPDFMCYDGLAVGTKGYFVLTDSDDDEPASGNTPSFGHTKIFQDNSDSERHQVVYALAKSKGILLDQVISILMPILHRD